MNVNDIGRAAARTTVPENEALRRVAVELESVFLARLMQAMRDAIPADDEAGDRAQQTFGFLMDQRLASLAAGRAGHGLADMVYRQLARQSGLAPAPVAAEANAATAARAVHAAVRADAPATRSSGTVRTRAPEGTP